MDASPKTSPAPVLPDHMDPRSEGNLDKVHPDLCRVIREAAKVIPFLVIHGIRSAAEEASIVARGASQTTHSRHLPNKEGFASAVVVAALADGHVSWEPTLYLHIWGAVQDASERLDIPVEWGGSWKTLKDFGHFQLPWASYP